MRVFAVESALVAFSSRHDGNLGFYRMSDAQALEIWQNLDLVVENKLAGVRYLRQVHGAELRIITEADAPGLCGEADAVATDRPDVPVGVFTADCLPILAVGRRSVAAIHAGWKSTLAGICARSVEALQDQFQELPQDVQLFFGPCIGCCCLEMGEEVPEQFRAADQAFLGAFSRGIKWHLDLRGLNVMQALTAGVPMGNMTHVNDCTKCRTDDYYSYRDSAQREGSMFSFVVRQSTQHHQGGTQS